MKKKSLQYEMGYDAGLNGPNEENCNFRLFGSELARDEWSEGNADGLIAKERLKKKSF